MSESKFSKVQIKKNALFLAVLFMTAFLCNFCWESIQGLLYEAHPEMAAHLYVPMMLFMAAMDSLGIIVLYALTALLVRRWYWESNVQNNSIFFLAALVSAGVVEYIALNVFHLWHYLPLMPHLFGVGLFPLFQISLTGVASVYITRKLALIDSVRAS
jgi:hypothetical protein